MAHRIYAIDLGAWSVKVAIADHGFRQATVSELIERPVPPAEGALEGQTHEVRAARVLASIVAEFGLEHDTAYFVVPGDQVFTKVLDFQFQNLRRQDLEKAVGAELEGVVPIDLEDMVYAFEPIPKIAAAAPPGAGVAPIDLAAAAAPTDPDAEPTKVQGQGLAVAGPRGRVAAPADGMRVLTYAMRRDRAQALIAVGAGAKAEPRGLLPIAGALARFAGRVSPGVPATIAVIDMGHERTDVVMIAEGRPVFSRTIARGGRHVTDAIARAWKLPAAQAEAAKHSDGIIASSAEPAQSEAWARISEVVAAELVPLARDLRQTFAACRARTGVAVASAVLVGGGARLRGMPSFLAEQLGVPVTPPGPADAGRAGPRLAELAIDHMAAPIGAALDGATGRPLFDLRQGALSFKVDLTFVRAKAYQLAAAMVVVLAFAAASAWAAHYKLHKNEQILTDRLAAETTALYGSPKTADEILNNADMTAAAAASPLPKMSAYDIMLAINEKLPARDKITLDVTQLDINEAAIEIRGTTKVPAEIDALVTALKDVPCLGEASRGSTQQTAEGSQFQLSYKHTCM